MNQDMVDGQAEGEPKVTDFLIANMAPIIFASLVFFLLLGFPVAFALAANGIVFGCSASNWACSSRPSSRRCRSASSAAS